MIRAREATALAVVAALFILSAYAAKANADTFEQLIRLQGATGMSLYVVGAMIATVIAPLSFLPFLPIAVALFGSFTAAWLSILGWTFGAIIAFWVARRYGRPLVERLVDMRRIEQLERLIGSGNLFWSVVFFRIALPVDILSYALGLFTRMRFVPYVVATLIGITPFAFVFSYLSTIPTAFLTGALLLGVAVALLGARSVRRYRVRNGT